MSALFFSKEAWYEFRIMAVMDDLVSEPSNIVGVSSTGEEPCGVHVLQLSTSNSYGIHSPKLQRGNVEGMFWILCIGIRILLI